MRRTLAATWLGLMIGFSALAQIPPSPSEPPRNSPWMAYTTAVVLLLMVGFSAFKPSKRGHQD